MKKSEPRKVLKSLFGHRIPVAFWWDDPRHLSQGTHDLGEALFLAGISLAPLSSLHSKDSGTRKDPEFGAQGALLPHLSQIHLDLSKGAVAKLESGKNPLEIAGNLVEQCAKESGATAAFLDLSRGTLEGGPHKDSSTQCIPENPWWIRKALGSLPKELSSYQTLGKGVGVALLDHPPDPRHPALKGRMAPPLEAWRLPHYPKVAPLYDDHGTGSAGLICGSEGLNGPHVGVAPGATVHPVHLWPGGFSAGAPDRFRILCRALELVRQRQLEKGPWAPVKILSQQYTITSLRAPAGMTHHLKAALQVLESAYCQAAGVWGLAVLCSGGSHPRAQNPVWPCGLAGVTTVGAIDSGGALVLRSPTRRLDFVATVSHKGSGPISSGAGGGYLEQGQATSSACPLAAAGLAASLSRDPAPPRRRLQQLLRKASKVAF